MGDVFGTVIVVILYLVIVSAGVKRKAQRKAKKAGIPREHPGNLPISSETKKEPPQERPQRMVTQLQMELARQEEEAPCREGPGIHLHSVSQQAMQAAGEGEDPCHAGGAPAYEHASPVYDSPITGMQEREALAQRVLDGVIMSEILTRPCERRARRTGYRA